MRSIKDLSPAEKPREKIAHLGPSSLDNTELLAVLLGRGTSTLDVLGLCRLVVQTIQEERNLTFKKLVSLHGIGPAKAAQILAALELSRRFFRSKTVTALKSSEDALPYLASLKASAQEEFVVVTLNASHEVIGTHHITRGLANSNLVHPRETFLPAIKDRAVSILVAHNHPSGNLEDSEADRETTRRLFEVSKIMGIPLLDHIILSRYGWASLRQKYPELFA